MIVGDFELLLHELEQLPELVHRSRVFALLRSFSGRRFTVDTRLLRRMERERVVRGLLASDMSRTEASRALQERLGVTDRTAQRLICRALASPRPIRRQELGRDA